MDEIAARFNEIFVRHYERLTGAKNAVGGLPFNMTNIGCLIILGGRELEMSDIMSQVSERYKLEEFLKEIKDAGLKSDDDIQHELDVMRDKKYLDIRPDGIVYSFQDTKETARMLNRIFPKMQGINLLAYIRQTIAEVESGRTDLEAALSRFDQTLNNHGVALPKPKIPKIVAEPAAKPKPQEEEPKPKVLSKGSRIIRDYIVKEASVRGPAAANSAVPSTPVEKNQAARTTVTPVREEETSAIAAASIHQEAPAPAENRMEKPQIISEEQRSISPKAVIEPEIQKNVSPADTQAGTDEQSPVDDEIAQKIAAFEKELALVCPICKTSVLAEKTTVAGKIYYTCTAENCNFISWGKPHHIECARCKNPFLVEVTDHSGQTILKCPRATCQHRQALNPKVKVVRKRVIRRK